MRGGTKPVLLPALPALFSPCPVHCPNRSEPGVTPPSLLSPVQLAQLALALLFPLIPKLVLCSPIWPVPFVPLKCSPIRTEPDYARL
uniref:Uncharacterized protein n=2 Tax=Picea TaxID=3328 RepID=A0A101M1E7_PICGL|nr:hypothetical protein ABT39_MTgene3691 [Picea glauca]QHR90324.1 hypothetical protein Q903MT_gene4347 [Picea sitchensis]